MARRRGGRLPRRHLVRRPGPGHRPGADRAGAGADARARREPGPRHRGRADRLARPATRPAGARQLRARARRRRRPAGAAARRRARPSPCSPPAGRGCCSRSSRPSRCPASRSRRPPTARATPSSSSSAARGRAAPRSPSDDLAARDGPVPRASTAWRWPSSWPPPGSRRSGSTASRRAWPTGSLLLTGGSRLDDRHRSLRSALDWSYALLDEPDRALLRRVSVFAGPFAARSAAEVLDGWDADRRRPGPVDAGRAGRPEPPGHHRRPRAAPATARWRRSASTAPRWSRTPARRPRRTPATWPGPGRRQRLVPPVIDGPEGDAWRADFDVISIEARQALPRARYVARAARPGVPAVAAARRAELRARPARVSPSAATSSPPSSRPTTPPGAVGPAPGRRRGRGPAVRQRGPAAATAGRRGGAAGRRPDRARPWSSPAPPS